MEAKQQPHTHKHTSGHTLTQRWVDNYCAWKGTAQFLSGQDTGKSNRMAARFKTRATDLHYTTAQR